MMTNQLCLLHLEFLQVGYQVSKVLELHLDQKGMPHGQLNKSLDGSARQQITQQAVKKRIIVFNLNKINTL